MSAGAPLDPRRHRLEHVAETLACDTRLMGFDLIGNAAHRQQPARQLDPQLTNQAAQHRSPHRRMRRRKRWHYGDPDGGQAGAEPPLYASEIAARRRSRR